MNDRLLRSIAIVLGTLSAGLAVASVALIALSPSTVSIKTVRMLLGRGLL